MRDYRQIVIEQLARRIDDLETSLASEKFWRGEAEHERDELKKAASALPTMEDIDAAVAATEEEK